MSEKEDKKDENQNNEKELVSSQIELEEKEMEKPKEAKEHQNKIENKKIEENKISEEKDENDNKLLQNKRKMNKPDINSKASQRKRKKELCHKNDGMCQYFFKTGHCEREECHFSHDIKSYLPEAKFLEGPCPIYTKYGTCPSGFLCLWGKEHIDFEKVELKKNEELMNKNPIEKELNILKGEEIHKVRKGNF